MNGIERQKFDLVDSQRLTTAIAAHLKHEGKLNVPSWVGDVKTSSYKVFVPDNDDWFYIRAAAIMRRLCKRKAGVGALGKVFGGKTRKMVKPAKTAKASGNSKSQSNPSIRNNWMA
eukprot:gnl/Chilomastix_caulleri/8906.p1 GENE.gnl/Chilomastix_caulleri/8906~~gnl/Chilomastix_caulleri/8906.p1  ORF type:complete len:116 (+),score=17.36 gnl/Chilomastix_caulleri/8906:2-349(+)